MKTFLRLLLLISMFAGLGVRSVSAGVLVAGHCADTCQTPCECESSSSGAGHDKAPECPKEFGHHCICAHAPLPAVNQDIHTYVFSGDGGLFAHLQEWTSVAPESPVFPLEKPPLI